MCCFIKVGECCDLRDFDGFLGGASSLSLSQGFISHPWEYQRSLIFCQELKTTVVFQGETHVAGKSKKFELLHSVPSLSMNNEKEKAFNVSKCSRSPLPQLPKNIN